MLHYVPFCSIIHAVCINVVHNKNNEKVKKKERRLKRLMLYNSVYMVYKEKLGEENRSLIVRCWTVEGLVPNWHQMLFRVRQLSSILIVLMAV